MGKVNDLQETVKTIGHMTKPLMVKEAHQETTGEETQGVKLKTDEDLLRIDGAHPGMTGEMTGTEGALLLPRAKGVPLGMTETGEAHHQTAKEGPLKTEEDPLLMDTEDLLEMDLLEMIETEGAPRLKGGEALRLRGTEAPLVMTDREGPRLITAQMTAGAPLLAEGPLPPTVAPILMTAAPHPMLEALQGLLVLRGFLMMSAGISSSS